MKRNLLLLAVSTLALGQNPPTMFPPVRGTREMVGAANNVEVEAGFRLLTQGGNAVDAGVATVLAAAVSEQDHFGLGGEIPILIKMAGKPGSRRPACARVRTPEYAEPWTLGCI